MPPLRTYIVEDSPLVRDSLIATLEELLPLEVVGTAEDESTASQWLTQQAREFDLAIIDIALKTGSGLGVLRAARALPRRHKLVVLSNYATPEMRSRCLDLGADQVFDKAHELEALIDYCGQLATDGRSGNGPSMLN